jgi:CBS domain containing-hemolysin-like protein
MGDHRWKVDGSMLTDDLATAIGVEFPDGDWTTVAGLVMSLAGSLPRPGTEIDAGDCRIRVVAMRRRRIRRVVVTVADPK